jgi:hypothetical protein
LNLRRRKIKPGIRSSLRYDLIAGFARRKKSKEIKCLSELAFYFFAFFAPGFIFRARKKPKLCEGLSAFSKNFERG